MNHYTTSDFKGNKTHHTVVFCEFDSKGHPHNVVTISNDGHRQEWDFNWSKRHQTLYYSCSGGGGSKNVTLSEWVDKTIPHQFYADTNQITLTRSIKRGKEWTTTPATCDWWTKQNMERILTLPENPFQNAQEEETVYCQTCNDWFPYGDNSMCEHLQYCETCESIVHVLPSGRHSSHWDSHKHPHRHSLN